MKLFRVLILTAVFLLPGLPGAEAQDDSGPLLIQEDQEAFPEVPQGVLNVYRGGLQSLRGIKEVCVVVLPLDPQVEADGLFRKQIHFELTLELVRGGVSLIQPEAALQEENPVYLFAYVKTLNFDGLNYTYQLGMALYQGVSLLREPETLTYASTWHSEDLGVVPAGQIRDLSHQFVPKAQDFCADLAAANR